MFRSLMTIIKELYLYLTSYIYVKTFGKTTPFHTNTQTHTHTHTHTHVYIYIYIR